ncbi:hypothetical protein, partial [Virgibacillus senegalensis]|uniref:hypothetical protein n=1 Tax=Virgibacillus senegalensis TaxID=1499679 RepID=UPI001F1E42EA
YPAFPAILKWIQQQSEKEKTAGTDPKTAKPAKICIKASFGVSPSPCYGPRFVPSLLLPR